jgi:hypothetical protein
MKLLIPILEIEIELVKKLLKQGVKNNIDCIIVIRVIRADQN